MSTDIHKLKELQDQLRDAVRDRDEFLAILGHELRNPLAGILGGVQVLEHIGASSAEAHEIQQVIARQARLMQRLIDNLLDVSRMARGKVALRKERLNLSELVRQAAHDHRLQFTERGQDLTLDVPDRAFWCDGDRERLLQVIGNLLHNACKFTDSPGKIAVRLWPDPAAGQAVLQVTDTGIGMDADTQRRIFEPFAQANCSPDRNGSGLGFGLALVRGLAKLHGGTVEAASPGLGQGSTFTVRLPTATVEADAAQNPRLEPANGDAEKLRVLLIDDRRDASFPIMKLLQSDGHEVQVAVDGPAGLEAAQRFRPDVVLCDIRLPGMDGYEVARKLRAEEQFVDTFLIAATGYGEEEDQRRAKEAGFDLHLAKPVDVHTLKPLLARIAAERSLCQVNGCHCGGPPQ